MVTMRGPGYWYLRVAATVFARRNRVYEVLCGATATMFIMCSRCRLLDAHWFAANYQTLRSPRQSQQSSGLRACWCERLPA